MMRGATAFLLAIAWIFLFSGCPQEHTPDMAECSYVAQAYHGYFTPNKADSIYELYLDNLLPGITWHKPQPTTDTGVVSWPAFAKAIWPEYLADMKPIGAIACRLEDGAWTMLAAQFLDVEVRHNGEAVCSVKLTQAPPRGMLTGVAVYVDNQGDTSLMPYNTGIFLLGPAQARFDATETANRYEVALNVAAPEILSILADPDLAAGPQSLEYFVTNLWPDAYAGVSPHATFVVETEDGTQQTVVAALSEPAWDYETKTLRFDADLLTGAAQDLAGAASMVLDNGIWNANDFGGDDGGDLEPYGQYKVVYTLYPERMLSMAPAEQPLIAGWHTTGFKGRYSQCLEELFRLQALGDCPSSGCTQCAPWGDCLD